MPKYLIITVISLLLCGCNNDIFVEDTTVSESTLTIAGDGGRGSVRIKRSGLKWYGLDVQGGKYPITCYDREGKEVPVESPASDIARINYKSVDLWFDITLEGDELTVVSTENCGLLKIQFSIKLDYGFKNEYVYVVVEPGKLMEFEGMEYDWSRVSINPTAKIDKGVTTYINGSEYNMHVDFHPFINSKATVVYDPEDSWADYLDAFVRVPVLKDGEWSLGEERSVTLASQNKFTPTSADMSISVPIDIAAGDSLKVSNYIRYSSMTVPFEVKYRNPVSGRRFSTTGLCTATEPTDYEVRINE